HVVSRAEIYFGHPGFWNPPSGLIALSNKEEIIIQSGSSETLHLDLHPHRIYALFATWKHVKPDEGNDTVSLKIVYTSQFNPGIPHEILILIPIRFIPSFPNLGVFLLMGLMLGTLVRQMFFRIPIASLATLKTLATNLIFVVGIEALAMALVFLGSKFVLFGLELDPWQTITVFLIGFFVGLGGKKTLDALIGKLLNKRS